MKGSTVDREASDKEKEKELPTLKDNDFVKDGTKVVIGDEAKERLMETLTADVEVIDSLKLLRVVLLTMYFPLFAIVFNEVATNGLFSVAGGP